MSGPPMISGCKDYPSARKLSVDWVQEEIRSLRSDGYQIRSADVVNWSPLVVATELALANLSIDSVVNTRSLILRLVDQLERG
jgi:trans-aconitate methyltransferase